MSVWGATIREGGAQNCEGDKGVLPLGEVPDIVKGDNHNIKPLAPLLTTAKVKHISWSCNNKYR